MRILVIRFSSLGDVILTTAILPLLKQQYNRAEIFFLTKAPMADIVKYNPHVDSLLLLDQSGIQGLWHIIKQVKSLKVDLIVDLHKNLRSFFIKNYLRNIPSITYQKAIGARRLLVKTKKGKGNPFPHVVERYIECIAPSMTHDKNFHNFVPKVWVSDEELLFADRLLSSVQTNLLIGINPGARWTTKKWPADYFAECADLLIEKEKAHIAILGAYIDRDTAEEILKHMRNKDMALTICGQTTILQLAACIRRCNLIITNDSGPMHLAVSQEIPVVALFGPTSKEFGFYPLGKKDRVIEVDLPCRPCSLHGSLTCPQKHFRCMRDITPQMVLEAAQSVLASSQ